MEVGSEENKKSELMREPSYYILSFNYIGFGLRTIRGSFGGGEC